MAPGSETVSKDLHSFSAAGFGKHCRIVTRFLYLLLMDSSKGFFEMNFPINMSFRFEAKHNAP